MHSVWVFFAYCSTCYHDCLAFLQNKNCFRLCTTFDMHLLHYWLLLVSWLIIDSVERLWFNAQYMLYQCWVSLYVVGVRWYTSDAVGRYCHSEYSTDFDDASSTLSSPHEWDDQEDGRSCRKPKEMHYGIPGSHRGGGRADRWNVESSLYDRRSPNITTTTYDISLTYLTGKDVHQNVLIIFMVAVVQTKRKQTNRT